MRITLLCNAGLAIEYNEHILLVDVPNMDLPPFAPLPDDEWEKILNRKDGYQSICGLYFTHNHPDHCDEKKVKQFMELHPDIPVFMPEPGMTKGNAVMGPFVVSYELFDHAPMNEPLPPHVVTWIMVGDKSIYIAADAKLDVDLHRQFLKGRVASAAFWNAMYLSRAETRSLMHECAAKNFVYHMPVQEPDAFGIWRKCRNNLARYGDELKDVTIIGQYPFEIEL